MEKIDKHILVITSWFPDRENPLAVPFIFNSVKSLNDRFKKVQVLHLDYQFKNKLVNPQVESYNINGQKAIRQKLHGKIPKCYKLNLFLNQKRVDRIFRFYSQKHGTPDILFSHTMVTAGLHAGLLASKYNIPLFHTEHDSNAILNYKKGYYSAKFDKFWTLPSVLHFVSQYQQKEIIDLYRIKDTTNLVIHNMLSKIYLKPLEPVKNNIFTFAFISFVREVKDPELLFHALSFLKGIRQDWKIIITLDGPSKKRHLHLINKLSLIPFLKIYPNQNQTGVFNLLSKTDVLLSTSKIETFGIVLIEALSRGKPIITTDSGGVRDIIEHNHNGYLVTERDPKQFALAMNKMMNNYHRFDNMRLHQETINKWNPDLIMDKITAELVKL